MAYSKEEVTQMCAQYMARASQKLNEAQTAYNAALAAYKADSAKVCKRIEKEGIPIADFIAACDALETQTA